MSAANTAEWMAMLEAVAQRPPDQAGAEWEWLMEQLGLGPEYFLAIYEAVQEGRWRGARDPKAYLKTVARRVAAEMELPAQGDARLVFPGEIECDGEEVTQEERLDYMQYQQDSVRPIQGADGVWRPGAARSGRGNYRNFLVAKVPGELRAVEPPDKELREVIEQINASTADIHIHLRPFIKARWAEWSEAAGLDEWEQQVLEYKLNGLSREHGLGAQPDEGSRKALQAAWRRFDRNGAKRLLEAAKKISVENVPE